MPSFYKKHSLQTISIIVLIALLCNAVVFNVLMKPKIAKALGEEWAVIGHFILAIGQKIWEGAKWVAQKAWDAMTFAWQKVTEAKKWCWELAKSALQTAARTLQRKLLTSITNTTVDVIEGRTSISDAISGKKGYVTDYVKNLFYDSLAAGANQFSQELAGVDLCSPLGFETTAEAKIALNPPLSSKLADTMACTRQQMGQNLKNFYASFEGGWGSWLNVTQPNQNFAGSYLLALDAKLNITSQEQEAGKIKVTAAGGWSGVEQCDEWFSQRYGVTFKKDAGGTNKFSSMQDFAASDIPALDLAGGAGGDMTPTTLFFALNFVDGAAQALVGVADTLTKCGLKADIATACANLCDIDQGANLNLCVKQDPCKNVNEDCLLTSLNFTCTKKSTKTPGQLVGQTFNKAVNWQSDWLLSSTEIGNAISVIADAAVNKVIGAGIDSLGSWINKKTTKTASASTATVFGSDTATIEQRQRDCKTRSSSIDRAACQKCAYVDPKRPEFKTCFDYEKAQFLSGAQLASNLGDSQFSANMEQVSILQQVIELKEQISRALQKMGGGAYYSNAQNPLKAMQLLSRCRWQNCASHEIRQFMMNYCGVDQVSDYGLLVKRDKYMILDFWLGNPPTGAVANCSPDDEKACTGLLNKLPEASKLNNLCEKNCVCTNEKNSTDEIFAPGCINDCTNSPHGFTRTCPDGYKFSSEEDKLKMSPCLELSTYKALNSHQKTLTENNLESTDSGAPFLINSEIESFTDPLWRANNAKTEFACFADPSWIQTNIDRANFYQQTPRFEDVVGSQSRILKPGWWDFNAKITIDDKIKSLEKEIGQDSGYPQLHPKDPTVGVVDMTYEYGEKCEATCLAQNMKNVTPDNVKDSPCYSDCISVDVFNELSPKDIEAIFTPPNGKPSLGSSRERKDKIGELRIQQWDILSLQSQADAEEAIRKFISTTIETCPATPQFTGVPAEDTAIIVKYENNIVQKVIAEQELYNEEPQLKAAAINMATRIGGSIGGTTYAYNAGCDITMAPIRRTLDRANRDQLDAAGVTSCPLIQLWLNYSRHSKKKLTTNTSGPELSGCDNYNPNDEMTTGACPLGCKINYDNGATTLLVQIENSIKTAQKTIEQESNTINSDGVSNTVLNDDLINVLNQQLTDINALMDPRNLRQKNQDIIQRLDEEVCNARIIYNYNNGTKKSEWPGAENVDN